MQDSKQMSWASDIATEHNSDSEETPATANERIANVAEKVAAETDGWSQYRKWISKAPAPRGRRTGIDPTLYTWRGYRNWTEQVKRKWSDS